MRKLTIALALLLLLPTLALGGCRATAPTATPEDGVLASLTDDELISRYVEGLDIALVGDNELLFSDSTTIPSSTLYMFFVHVTCQDRLYDYETWFSKADGNYRIPLAAVTDTLGKYFVAPRFDPTGLRGYDAARQEFVTPVFAGFGGGRFIKLRSKESLSANTVRLTADFYDGESFRTVVYTKAYTIEIGPTGYRYLSITRLP